MNRDELLDAVAESPNDDAPRLVYADWLQQQSDPMERARGEYISLACSNANDPDRAKKRMKELLERFQAGWLGPVADVTDARQRQWSRGFVEACSLELRPTRPMEPALGHHTWRTLRVLTTYGSSFPDDAVYAVLAQPELANLRGLYTYQRIVGGMATWPVAARVLDLAVAPSGEPFESLASQLSTESFARVRRLHVFGCTPQLGDTLARPGLTLIVVAAPDALGNWLATLAARDSAFDEVRLVSSVFPHLMRSGIELVVRRDNGRWSALEVRWSDFDGNRSRERTINALAELPEETITHLSFVGPSTKRFDVARWKQRIIAALEPGQPGMQIG